MQRVTGRQLAQPDQLQEALVDDGPLVVTVRIAVAERVGERMIRVAPSCQSG